MSTGSSATGSDVRGIQDGDISLGFGNRATLLGWWYRNVIVHFSLDLRGEC